MGRSEHNDKLRSTGVGGFDWQNKNKTVNTVGAKLSAKHIMRKMWGETLVGGKSKRVGECIHGIEVEGEDMKAQ